MSGIQHANGHRPDGVLDIVHPALMGASRPDPATLSYDLDRVLGAVFRLRAEVPPTAFTATILGTEREGNGVLIDENGLALTIGYLITEAESISLIDNAGRAVSASPVAYDHETGLGLVRADEPVDASPVPIGRSDGVSVKDPVVVASFGGIKHAIQGEVATVREFAGSWEYMLDEAICTVPVHPFWGGAALIDRSGSLIGCGSLYVEHSIDGGESVPGNLFVPIDLLAPIRDDMVRTGRARRAPRPWLGVYVSEADDRLVVTGVAENAPGDQCGVQPGDVILSAEGVAVSGLPEYYRTIWSAGESGTEIRLTVLRDDDVLSIRVRSGDRYSYLKLPRPH
ncbi:MAG: S1C family serine protease [Defluviicoccus sp.]|nr:S1C family serine protease [Defluviicoccus sp.]